MYHVQIKTKQMNEQKKESLDFENTNKERQKELERSKVETELEKTKVKNFIQNQNNKSDEIMSNINNIFSTTICYCKT